MCGISKRGSMLDPCSPAPASSPAGLLLSLLRVPILRYVADGGSCRVGGGLMGEARFDLCPAVDSALEPPQRSPLGAKGFLSHPCPDYYDVCEPVWEALRLVDSCDWSQWVACVDGGGRRSGRACRWLTECSLACAIPSRSHARRPTAGVPSRVPAYAHAMHLCLHLPARVAQRPQTRAPLVVAA